VRSQGTRPRLVRGLGRGSVVDFCLGFVRDNYARNYSMSELATLAQISVSYMFRTFKRKTGLTPLRYRNRVRIDEAKRLLRDRALSLEQVARRVGFDDRKYFGRVFKKETGLSPREFCNRSFSGSRVRS